MPKMIKSSHAQRGAPPLSPPPATPVVPEASGSVDRHNRRTELRTELRCLIDGKFGEYICFTSHQSMLTADEAFIVNDPFAGLWYTIEDYAETNVIGYGYKIVGWPESIPFRNLSYVGGCKVLSELITLWKEDKIKFVSATPVDKLMASLDPTLVAPGKGFVHRKQSGGRNDIGRSRYRWKTMPEGGALRRPKDGPKTPKIVESEDEDGKAEPAVRPLRLQPLPLGPPIALDSFPNGGYSRAIRAPSEEIEDFSDEE
ncbi:hypothetical protein TRAPUB_197 [Trametes pubescens]|uniref:Uncharacterized protein n=1 Tax=Trametes pubescens TaxID=154538 RepID=A0A1M2VMV5_TRAPU|nr:hypothetical protein TRAPUB_197 [Trametes pubescens]